MTATVIPRTPIEPWRQKLAPPRATFPVVARAGAEELAVPRDGTRLVLVRAPAGFGKTSLLGSIYERRASAGERAVWLSLDAADNDPQRFLEYLDAALQAAPVQVSGAGWRDETAGGAPTFEAVLARIASGGGFSLFLDGVEVLSDPIVVSTLRELAASIPPNGTLFVGGRSIPDLRIGRLRSHGQVLEIGADELRFSPAESEQLLKSILGKRLAPELVTSLHERTEGWAAVLQLAALMLSKRSDHADYVAGFSGSSAELGSYLAEELLASQPDEVRELLLRSSICETICAELCDAVCDRTDSAALLRGVERDNLCLFRLDDHGEWFRFHELFGEYLRRQLRHQHHDEIPALHRRAAEWFARHDDKTSALEHAVQSGNPEYAAEMADAYAQALTAAGRLTTLIRAVQPLPKAVVERRPRLKVYYTICLTGAFHHRTAAPLIEEQSTPAVIAALDPDTRGALLFAIPFQMVLQDRFTDALAACEAHLSLLDPQDAQNRAAVMNVSSLCLLHLRRFDELQKVGAEAQALATGVTIYGLVSAECLVGMGELAQGRLHHATAIYEAALTTAVSESSANSAPTAVAAACLAEALYEAGKLERAEELLDRYLATITHMAIPDALIHAHVHHIRITYLRRDYAEACEAITRLKRVGYERDLPRVVAAAWAEHSRLALLRDDVAAAERYLQMAEANAPYTTLWDESSSTLRARLLTAKGRARDALELLDSELAGLDTESCRRQALKLRIVRATVLKASGAAGEALTLLATCVEDARPEGHVRVLVDEGERVATLLRELLATRPSSAQGDAFIRSLLEHLDDEHRPQSEPDERQDALSSRELEVLAHLADGLSNQAIADALVISLPTVKTHVHSLMSKLAAKNRTQAVAAARRRRLLER